MQKFGGNREYDILVIVGVGERIPMHARRLFESSLYLITSSGKYAGWLAYPKWDAVGDRKGKRFFPADVAYVVVPDLYWLFRLFTHGAERYEQDRRGEIPNLHKSLQHLQEIHSLLLGKPDAKRLDELKEQIKHEVVAVIAYLKPNARESHKKRAIEQAIEVATGRDSMDRFNPGAFAARIVAAINAVLIRESDAMSINAIFAQWRRLTQSMLCILEYEVDAQYTFLQKVLGDWDNLVSTKESALMRRLTQYAKDLGAYDLNPFRETFFYVAMEMEEAVEFFRTNRPDLARTMLETAKNSLWLRKIRVSLESAMLAVSRKQRFPIVPFDKPKALRIIRANADEIHRLDTTHMRDFNQKLVVAGLDGVATALELPDWELAHERLREVIVRI